MQCIYKIIKMKTAEQQIEFIEEMIATAKGNIGEGSIFYLIWGWSVFIAAGINYYLLNVAQTDLHWLPWPIGMTLAGLLSMIVGFKKGKQGGAKSHLENFLGSLWLGFIITLFVVLSGMWVVGYEATYPILMALYGFGTFASGRMLKFKPLMIGGVCAWICAILSFYYPFSEQLIFIAVAILTAYIIPGHLLAAQNQKNG